MCLALRLVLHAWPPAFQDAATGALQRCLKCHGCRTQSHAWGVLQVLDDGTETNRGAVVGPSASAIDGAPSSYTPAPTGVGQKSLDYHTYPSDSSSAYLVLYSNLTEQVQACLMQSILHTVRSVCPPCHRPQPVLLHIHD